MSKMKSQSFHKYWLKITAIVVASFGPVFFLSTMQATSFPASFAMDLLWWPLDGLQNFDDPTTRFLSALTGGFLLGWGVMIWRLSGTAYDYAPEAVRIAVLSGLLAWFFLDSAGSVASGAVSNVFFNVAILLIAVGPLWWRAEA